MKALAAQIKDRLPQRDYFTVFGAEISRLWPLPVETVPKRDAAIRAFAKKNGLSATIRDSGIRVLFRNL